MNVLWIPIFSMRSYDTGKYAILKDGNFQLTMARIIASQYDHITVAVPDDASDFESAKYLYRNAKPGKLSTLKLKYGKNAVETREQFWDLNRKVLTDAIDKHQQFDRIITDITGYDIKSFHPVDVVYNFNITKLPELDRPYIDKFWEEDIQSIRDSLFTTVINPRQKEYIVEQFPELEDKVKVHLKVAHTKLLQKSIVPAYPPKTIFWPFRISDKSYQWEQFLAAFEQQKLHEQGWTIICTDPNDTLKDSPGYVFKLKPTKEEYYAILQMKPIVVMLDDIDTVLHPGTIEIMHYGCPVVTYWSELIDNPMAINDLRMLHFALQEPVYNGVDTSRFIYKADEKDELHK